MTYNPITDYHARTLAVEEYIRGLSRNEHALKEKPLAPRLKTLPAQLSDTARQAARSRGGYSASIMDRLLSI